MDLDFISKQQSKNWDMDISLKELIEQSPKCKVDRDYRLQKYDGCIKEYCIYVNHPNNGLTYNTMIGITEDGFVYLGEGEPYKSEDDDIDLPLENTLDVLEELILYKDYIIKKLKNIFKL